MPARAVASLLASGLVLAGCGTVSKVRNLAFGPPSPYLSGYVGAVSADEPIAAQTGRDVLARGGNAADAAAATAFALSVTLPSRASLGSGGACLAYRPDRKDPPEAFLFQPVAGSGGPHADRPAAVPMMARGIFLMQARYGSVGFDELVRPASRLAHGGITVSRAFADDLAAVSGPLLADPGAQAVFAPAGTPVKAGDQLVQPLLGETLDQLAVAGAGDVYTGLLAQRLAEGATKAGGGLTTTDLRNALPSVETVQTVSRGNVEVGFSPADGGLARSAFEGGDATRSGRLPASTSFVVMDRDGGAVACDLTMNNLFGTGRIAGETGVVLAASPARVSAPLLPAAIAFNASSRAFRAAVSGSGQGEAAAAVGSAMSNLLRGAPAAPVTDAGRVNSIACSKGLPGDSGSCVAATDPRGMGLATRPD
ncbi:gamma-glutamyltransferase [Rhizosaccharibacter radicis]|uniref:Gamma-glutamyltransferase n=1 Tax=Rhizosaccharibacter radicis TaxID=2782605 RepID=A0ABT1VUT2_9PROT|nr:gamma-glutamyltransferase [Acetobacteraceae bacterium KSS12]